MKVLFRVQKDGKILVNTFGEDVIANIGGASYTSDKEGDWKIFTIVRGDYLEIEIDEDKQLPNPSMWDKLAENPLYL